MADQAILRPGITLLEASAGTGKTFQISHKALRLVAEEGIPVTRLLVVTFTEAASSELRERVRRRLRDGLRGLQAARDGQAWDAPDEVLGDWVAGGRTEDELATQVGRLRQALVDFDEASISTIHAFCNQTLRRFAFECRASFDADLAGSPRELIEELATDFWTNVHYDADEALAPALKAAGMTLEQLEDLAGKAEDPGVPVIPAPPAPGSLPRLPDVEPWRRAYSDARAVWQSPQKWELMNLVLSDDFWDRAARGKHSSFPAKKTIKMRQAAGRFFRYWPDVTAPLPDGLRYFSTAHAREAAKHPDSFPTHPLMGLIDRCIQAQGDLAPRVAPWVVHLRHQVVQQVREVLPLRLLRDNARTYDQLLRVLRDALCGDGGEELAGQLRDVFEVALIDEFQDTDPVQWEIFWRVFSGRMCLIGDPKQAIYAFRKADVHAYFRASGQVQHHEPLHKNFRSDRPLVEAINHLFAREGLRRSFGEHIPFAPATAHHGKRLDDGRPPLELRFLPTVGAGRKSKRNWLEERLPQVVAADVARELAAGTRIIGGDRRRRRLTPGDCAVLVRKNDQARQVQAALRALRIPTVIRSDDSVFSSREATQLQYVLAAALEPRSAGNIRAALGTDLLGRNAADIAALETDDQAWVAHAGNFRGWHTTWVEHGFMAMFREVMDGQKVAERLLALADGDRRMTNLAHLGELLDREARSRRLGPSSLLTWLERGGPGLDPEEARLRLETDADAVKVVTVHSSKGLEYPLVWCPYVWSNTYVSNKDRLHLRFHHPGQDNRLLLDVNQPKDPQHVSWYGKEQMEEELRLLYVALTRARHRCVAYWGVAELRDTALGYLLHQNPSATDEQLIEFHEKAWRTPRRDDDVHGALEDLAGEHEGICASRVDWRADSEADPWAPDADEYGDLARCRQTRDTDLDSWWRAGSFSGFVRGYKAGDAPDLLVGADEEDEPATGPDEVLAAGAPDEEPPSGDDTPVVLPEQLRGTNAGSCFHRILELHDFSAPGDLAGLVHEQLTAFGFDAGEHGDQVTAALQVAIDTPWRDDEPRLRLADIARDRRLDELEFMFRVQGGFQSTGARVTVADLHAAFAGELGPGAPPDYAERVGKLKFLPLRGFLHGLVDMVFEHRGRWYVVDYKSNHLGPSWRDYHPAALRREMSHAQYVLQYHIYTVALYRYLEWKLGPGAFERCFGGVYYLFIRGMAPHQPPGHGVYHDRPPLGLVQRLDAMFQGGAP